MAVRNSRMQTLSPTALREIETFQRGRLLQLFYEISLFYKISDENFRAMLPKKALLMGFQDLPAWKKVTSQNIFYVE